MGATSSSAFWMDISFDHSLQHLNAFYEKQYPPPRIIKNVQFSINDAKKLLDKKNLFPDITLILDIDATLGEACSIYNKDDKLFLDGKQVNKYDIYRLLENRYARLFHNGTCLFFIRPYFEQFIRFCDNNFKEVIIWTNGIQQHADDMVSLVKNTIGKEWKGLGREYSTNERKIVSTIGLDPNKTWLVDDDNRHYYVSQTDDSLSVNPDIKFFHSPEFSMLWFKDLHEKIPFLGKTLQIYDDWFLFLIWNWNYMKENGIDMKEYIRNKKTFIY